MTALSEVAQPPVGLPNEVRPLAMISGAYVFVPRPRRDQRGFLSRTIDHTWLHDAGIDPRLFVQDSVSRTRQGVVRGLHLRRGRGGAMLVRCPRGVVLYAVVDLRTASPTFRNVLTIELRADPPVTLYVPSGCAHGFQALTEPADVTYRHGRENDPSDDVTIAYDDPDIAIAWPLRPAGVSHHDGSASSLSAVLGSSR